MNKVWKIMRVKTEIEEVNIREVNIKKEEGRRMTVVKLKNKEGKKEVMTEK